MTFDEAVILADQAVWYERSQGGAITQEQVVRAALEEMQGRGLLRLERRNGNNGKCAIYIEKRKP